MIRIVLNDEQAELLSHAEGPVHFVDRSGRELGELNLPKSCPQESCNNSDADIALALQRMEEAKQGRGIYYTTEEVLDHLRSLEQS